MTQMHSILPAEWEPQSGILLFWPHANTDWKYYLEEVERTYVAIVDAIIQFEWVAIACNDLDQKRHVQSLFTHTPNYPDSIRIEVVPYNDTWVRDYGPIAVRKNGTMELLNFQFNGWGEKYDYHLDNQSTARLHQHAVFANTPLTSVNFILEGGSIESDGQGTLLTTSRCLLRRHPGRTINEITQQLIQFLSVARVLWLHHGHLEGDDTDGHIDTLARFCNPSTIVYSSCRRKNDAHYATLFAMEQELMQFTQANGNAYTLLPLPIPDPIYDRDGNRLPASYANFLILNQAVLVPTYADPEHDAHALNTLAQCFPEREIIGIDCRALIQQYGSLHCMTMQLPAGAMKNPILP